MRKILLPAALVLASITPSMAAFWSCSAPEIDAGSGMSAIAAIVAVAFIVHHKRSRA